LENLRPLYTTNYKGVVRLIARPKADQSFAKNRSLVEYDYIGKNIGKVYLADDGDKWAAYDYTNKSEITVSAPTRQEAVETLLARWEDHGLGND